MVSQALRYKVDRYHCHCFVDCLAKGILVNGKATYQSKKEAEEETETALTALSAWHCWRKCESDDDCIVFSWTPSGLSSEKSFAP